MLLLALALITAVSVEVIVATVEFGLTKSGTFVRVPRKASFDRLQVRVFNNRGYLDNFVAQLASVGVPGAGQLGDAAGRLGGLGAAVAVGGGSPA